MAGSFKQYNPLYKLNMGLIRSEVFPQKKAFRCEPSFRYKKFCACMHTFERNYFMRLRCLLRRLAENFNITYMKKDRIEILKYQVVKDSMFSGNDLVMFFIVVKILLDDMAFFVPFYCKEPILYGKKKVDIRDSEHPWSFKGMENHFLKSKSLDQEFSRGCPIRS